MTDKPLEASVIREDEFSMSELWYGTEEAKCGHSIDGNKISPPYENDFGMFAEQ